MTRGRLIVYSSIGAGLTALIFANAHLVYVAFASQPDCIRHIKPGEGSLQTGAFSAAKSACAYQKRRSEQ